MDKVGHESASKGGSNGVNALPRDGERGLGSGVAEGELLGGRGKRGSQLLDPPLSSERRPMKN